MAYIWIIQNGESKLVDDSSLFLIINEVIMLLLRIICVLNNLVI